MPEYDFRCVDCGKTFDVNATVEEKEKGMVCLYCGSANLEQLMTGFNVLGSCDRDSVKPG